MKMYLDGVLVVEGKEDASYLSNYISSEIVVVNGYELDERTINIEIDINKCNRGKKNGVAECEIEEIIGKLQAFSVKNPENTPNITISDLYSLGITESSELREYVSEKLNLGKCNNKQLLKRMNLNQVQLDLLKKIVEEYHGN